MLSNFDKDKLDWYQVLVILTKTFSDELPPRNKLDPHDPRWVIRVVNRRLQTRWHSDSDDCWMDMTKFDIGHDPATPTPERVALWHSLFLNPNEPTSEAASVFTEWDGIK